MPTPGWTRAVIFLAAATWTLIIFVSGGSLRASWAKSLGLAAAIVVFLLLAFDRWIWRWPGVRHVVRHPVLHGTWKTELRTSYEARADEVIEAYLVIRQTYSKICVAMLFDRSQSSSMSGDLIREDGRRVLYYVFRSDKQTLQKDENPPSAQLTVATRPLMHLEGDYWMEHGSRGRVVTVGRSPVIYDTFTGARTGEYR
jgi:hypothetical protein